IALHPPKTSSCHAPFIKFSGRAASQRGVGPCARDTSRFCSEHRPTRTEFFYIETNVGAVTRPTNTRTHYVGVTKRRLCYERIPSRCDHRPRYRRQGHHPRTHPATLLPVPV